MRGSHLKAGNKGSLCLKDNLQDNPTLPIINSLSVN